MPGRKSDCKIECSQEPCFVILPLQTHQAPLGCSEDTFIAIVLGTELISSASGVEGIETEGTPLSSRVELELELAQQVNSRSAQCRWGCRCEDVSSSGVCPGRNRRGKGKR